MSRRKSAAAAAAAVAASAHLEADDDDNMEEANPKSTKEVSGFISKIFKMVSDPSTQDVVSWNDQGDGFIVKNEFVFASQIMRTYFRHQNFSSFVRQLNFYGFHKRSSPSSLTSFFHPHFRQGHPELLAMIQRKPTEAANTKATIAADTSGLRDMVTTLQGEVHDLRQQNEDLFKIQQRILYIFSRYMRATTGSVQGAASVPIPQQEAGSKRIRGSDALPNKRQRLLMEPKPNSPNDSQYTHDLAAAASSSSSSYRPNSDYFPSNTNNNNYNSNNSSSHSDPHVVDLNTSMYNHTYPEYGNHSLSDLNWSSDPLGAINELIAKSGGPLQQALNSTNPLPIQMGRAGATSNYAGDNLHLLPAVRRSGRAPAPAPQRVLPSSVTEPSNILDLGSQLAGRNPKQLLELLDRMGAETQPSSLPAENGRGLARQRSIQRAQDAPYTAASSTYAAPSPNFGSNGGGAISGVFEDVDESDARRISRGAIGARRTKEFNQNGPSTSPTIPAAAASTGGATLSPLDDDISFPIKSSNSPVLNSLPLPTSPISPFVDSDFPSNPSLSHNHAFGSYELRSPMLSRATSNNVPHSGQPSSSSSSHLGVNDSIPFNMHSPYNGSASASSLPNALDLQPLTPNHLI